MSEKHSAPWWDDLVEAYVDGALPDEKAAQFDAESKTDPDLAAEIALAKAIRHEFRAMPQVPCPESVTEAVMRRVRLDLPSRFSDFVRRALPELLGTRLRPAVAMAVLLAIVVASSLFQGGAAPADPSVADALADVKWTLAYLSDITKQTGSTVRSEAIEPLVLESMHEAVGTFIDN